MIENAPKIYENTVIISLRYIKALTFKNCRQPMNKQQLASKIWDSANKMRSKIEANEYKDYILGFMFYKFLSDKEQAF